MFVCYVVVLSDSIFLIDTALLFSLNVAPMFCWLCVYKLEYLLFHIILYYHFLEGIFAWVYHCGSVESVKSVFISYDCRI